MLWTPQGGWIEFGRRLSNEARFLWGVFSMATDIENLEARRSAILAQLANMATTAGVVDNTKQGSKANVKTGKGPEIDHVQYRLSLLKELEMLNQMINEIEGVFIVDGEAYV